MPQTAREMSANFTLHIVWRVVTLYVVPYIAGESEVQSGRDLHVLCR